MEKRYYHFFYAVLLFALSFIFLIVNASMGCCPLPEIAVISFVFFALGVYWLALALKPKLKIRSRKAIALIVVLICVISFVIFVYVDAPRQRQNCSLFKLTVEALCATKMTEEKCNSAVFYPGQLGTDKQCIWTETTSGNFSCQVNQDHPDWDWSNNEEGAC